MELQRIKAAPILFSVIFYFITIRDFLVIAKTLEFSHFSIKYMQIQS